MAAGSSCHAHLHCCGSCSCGILLKRTVLRWVLSFCCHAFRCPATAHLSSFPDFGVVGPCCFWVRPPSFIRVGEPWVSGCRFPFCASAVGQISRLALSAVTPRWFGVHFPHFLDFSLPNGMFFLAPPYMGNYGQESKLFSFMTGVIVTGAGCGALASRSCWPAAVLPAAIGS